MSTNNMDLQVWGGDTGDVKLAFWDCVHGENRIFVLQEDDAFEEIIEGDEEKRVPVDLCHELRGLAFTFHEEGKEAVRKIIDTMNNTL